MDAGVSSRVCVLICAALVFVTGCPQPAPPENAVTWGVKAARGQLTETTPREWQAAAEKIDKRTPDAEISLSDEQAEVIVEFLQTNDLDTLEEVTDLIERAQHDPSVLEECEIPDHMIDLFNDVDFNSLAEGFLAEVQGGLPAR